MSYEIERKFLVAGDGWREQCDAGQVMCQGYLTGGGQGSVRVRLSGSEAWLNIKGATVGAKRREFEYLIPVADAEIILDELCAGPLIEKTRFCLRHGGHTWEIDVFAGDNDGLVVAEVELDAADEAVELPAWLGREVTEETRYYNAALVKHPFSQWNESDRPHADAT
jgi:adenylate cyclase